MNYPTKSLVLALLSSCLAAPAMAQVICPNGGQNNNSTFGRGVPAVTYSKTVTCNGSSTDTGSSGGSADAYSCVIDYAVGGPMVTNGATLAQDKGFYYVHGYIVDHTTDTLYLFTAPPPKLTGDYGPGGMEGPMGGSSGIFTTTTTVPGTCTLCNQDAALAVAAAASGNVAWIGPPPPSTSSLSTCAGQQPQRNIGITQGTYIP